MDEKKKDLAKVINRYFGADAAYLDIDVFTLARRILEEGYEKPIRCKNCEYWGGITFGNVCRRWSAPLAGMKNCTKPDDFCSYGKEKDTDA